MRRIIHHCLLGVCVCFWRKVLRRLGHFSVVRSVNWFTWFRRNEREKKSLFRLRVCVAPKKIQIIDLNCSMKFIRNGARWNHEMFAQKTVHLLWVAFIVFGSNKCEWHTHTRNVRMWKKRKPSTRVIPP